MPTAPHRMPAPLDPAVVRQAFTDLADRPLPDAPAVQTWLADYSALAEALSEAGSRRHIAHACDTRDADAEAAFLEWIRERVPDLEPRHAALRKKFLALDPAQLPDEAAVPGIGRMRARWRNAQDLYRVENIPLQTRVAERAADYGKCTGAMTVDLDGKTHTLQQAAGALESTDRTRREVAWRAVWTRRLQDRDRLDGWFDELLALRHRLAQQAGLADFRAYAWKAYDRFDYTPDEALAFGQAVESQIVPLVAALDRRRAEALGTAPLRPWDLEVDPEGAPPLQPFPAKRPDLFFDRVRALLTAVDPDLGAGFAGIATRGDLDLASRPGKQPGGFLCPLEVVRRPYIFMNAAGLQRDITVLLHEAGHALHYLHSLRIPLCFTRHAPMEFCEVASMSMELLGAEQLHTHLYPGAAEGGRAYRRQIEHSLRILPWIAVIDGFQHWLYTHPGHPREARTRAWRDLLARFFSPGVDWSGLEAERDAYWQMQIHLFAHPFYYIEYGLAQAGALGVWAQYRRAPAGAVRNLRAALARGGTCGLPELFETAGLPFDFSAHRLAELAGPLRQALGL